MGFGKTYEFSPIPEKLGILLVAFPDAGKTSFAARMVKPGKTGLVVDADGRFGEVVRQGMNFVRMSNKQSDMLDPKKIHQTMLTEMPSSPNVGLCLVDSVTQILEPIILEIQAEIEAGKSKGARGYKKKADAMKYLQAAVAPWDIDVIWVYHYREFADAQGNTKQGTSISELELARLYRNINLQLEIVVDKNGKRGVKVLAARGGRIGQILWDDSGTWENIRERLLDFVWGGLTEQEHTEIVKSQEKGRFASSAEAVSWAVEQGAFDDVEDYNGKIAKAKNSFKKLWDELKEELGDELNTVIMYEAWVEKVTLKIVEGVKFNEE